MPAAGTMSSELLTNSLVDFQEELKFLQTCLIFFEIFFLDLFFCVKFFLFFGDFFLLFPPLFFEDFFLDLYFFFFFGISRFYTKFYPCCLKFSSF